MTNFIKKITCFCLIFFCFALIQPISSEAQTSKNQLENKIKQLESEKENEKVDNKLNAMQININHQDKRIGDFTSNISFYSILITILLTLSVAVIAGFTAWFTYQNSKRQAKEEVEKWFEIKNNELTKNINLLIKDAKTKIHKHLNEIEQNLKESTEYKNKLEEIVKTTPNPNFVKFYQDNHQITSDINELVYNINSFSILDSNLSKKLITKTQEFVDKFIKNKPEFELTANEHFLLGCNFSKIHSFDNALKEFNLAIEKRNGETNENKIKYYIFKALTLYKLNQFNNSIAVINLINQRFCNDDEPIIRAQVADALFNKALMKIELHKNLEAIKIFDLIFQRYRDDNDFLIREKIINALYKKGLILAELNKKSKAIEVYDLIIKIFINDDKLNIRRIVANALNNKGDFLIKSNKESEAVEIYNLIIQRFINDNESNIPRIVANALNNKEMILIQSKNKELEAVEVCNLIINYFVNNNDLFLREIVARAFFNKSNLLITQNKYQEAIKTFTEIENRYKNDESPEIKKIINQTVAQKQIAQNKLNEQNKPPE